MTDITNINDANFDAEVLKSELPVLVDFWAQWCGPCKILIPILHDVAPSYEGRLKVVKVNVDDAKEIPAKYGIRGIPTLLVIKNGEVISTKVGAMTKQQLIDFIDEALSA